VKKVGAFLAAVLFCFCGVASGKELTHDDLIARLIHTEENSLYHEKLRSESRSWFLKRREELVDLAMAIHNETRANSHRHILDILKLLMGRFPGKGIGRLIAAIEDPSSQDVFPYDNFAYQALILLVRSWDKKDFHCHVSPSLSVQWVVDTVGRNRGLYEEEFRKRLYDDEYADWRRENAGTVTLEAIRAFYKEKDGKEIRYIFRKYENPTDAFDIPILCYPPTYPYDNLKIFIDAVRYVVRHYFSDGVRCVQLRFNPCKKFNGHIIPIQETLQQMYDAVVDEEYKASRKFGGKHRTEFMFCFNQSRYLDREDQFVKAVTKAFDYGDSEPYYERICGIDFSGPESSETRREGWKHLRNLAYKKGINLVFHGGDRWNLTDIFNEDVKQHLEYTKIAVETLGCEGRLGHGNVLIPWGYWQRAEAGCAERRFIDTDNYRSDVESILELMVEKEITLECLPQVEFRFIENMKQHPFYYWLKKGMKLDIGIDGTCYIPGALSVWVARLMLCSPREETEEGGVLTVSKMKEIVMWDFCSRSPSPIRISTTPSFRTIPESPHS
jgi:adenosine deaminase